MSDKLILENMQSLALFTRVFSYEFLTANSHQMKVCFYNDTINFISIAYKYSHNKNIIIGFLNNEPDGCFIGHYDDDGIPIYNIKDQHYTFINFEGIDNVKALVSQKVLELFGVEINL